MLPCDHCACLLLFSNLFVNILKKNLKGGGRGGGGGGSAAPPPPNPPAALFGSLFYKLGQLIWKKSSVPYTGSVSI